MTGRVQHTEVGRRARAASLEGDDGQHVPPIAFVDELTAPQAFTILLLPELLEEPTILQALQHSRALALREVVIPSRIERVGVRFDSDMPDNPDISR